MAVPWRGEDSDVEPLVRVCRACVALLPVDGASMSVISGTRHRETIFASDEVMGRVESVQFTLGEGPCFKAFTTRRPVLVPDLPHALAERWPAFASEIADQPICAIFAFPIQSGPITIGAMDMYRREPGLLTTAELATALRVVDVAAMALGGASADGQRTDMDRLAPVRRDRAERGRRPRHRHPSTSAGDHRHVSTRQAHSRCGSAQNAATILDDKTNGAGEMNHPAASEATREARLLRAFVEAADTLVDDYDVTEMLHLLAVHCVHLLDAAAAGFMVSDQRGSLQVLASSTERTRLLELFQIQADEGPCLDGFRTGETVLVPDLAEVTSRWPTSPRRRFGKASARCTRCPCGCARRPSAR